jgi:Zn-dependent metalloprotease
MGVLEYDPLTGTPRFVARLDGFLTGPSGDVARRIAMGFVRLHKTAFGLSADDMRTFVFVRDYVDIDGTHHLSWVQEAGGVRAFDNGLKANVTADGRLINVSGSPAHGLSGAAARAVPELSATQAMATARAAAGGPAMAAADDTAAMVLFHGGRSRLAWRTVTRISGAETALSVVDAKTGAILWRGNLTLNDVDGTGSAWESYPSTDVGGTGGTQQPVTFPVRNGNRLFGNNAHVYADTNDDNDPEPADEIPAVSGVDWTVAAQLDTTTGPQNCAPEHACTWDRTTANSWQTNLAQSAAQTYYYVNKFHDHLFANPIGFNEAAGNFQLDNTSGNGKDHDAVQVHVFDGAKTAGGLPDLNHYNNANMSTFPDGQAPIMQMYLFQKDSYSPGWVSGNSGDDAAVVYHEYTHGLSNRLVTYPNGWGALFSPQSGAMGEAWSDWYAMDLLVEEGWEIDTPIPGEVKTGEYLTGGEGIRYQGIDCGVGDPAGQCPGAYATGPGGFTFGDYGNVYGVPQVHSDGEIWAQTLWDLREKVGVDVARKLVTRAMELSPPEPSFLDMRNAIIQADLVAFGKANADDIWKVFAKRGMGYFASVTSASDSTPFESFKLPPDCASDPCGTIAGRVRDSATGKPLGNAAVGLSGHDTGFPGASMVDVTDSNGRFTIKKVPHGVYRDLVVDRRAYDVLNASITVNQQKEQPVFSLRRDWAALDGGAKIVSFSPPDYSFYGCGPTGAVDRSFTTGWGSKLPTPRSLVVKLPATIDVTSFGVDPGETCGDFPEAAAKAFDIYTRTATGSWVLAWHQTTLLPGGKLTTLVPSKGTQNVRFVKLVLRKNVSASNPFVDFSELSVRGRT